MGREIIRRGALLLGEIQSAPPSEELPSETKTCACLSLKRSSTWVKAMRVVFMSYIYFSVFMRDEGEYFGLLNVSPADLLAL